MRIFAIGMVVAVTALAGCVADAETGSASFYIKDAPTDEFDEIHLVLESVRVHQANATNETWITVW